MATNSALRIGTTRQLFVDDQLVEAMEGVRLQMHPPVHRENVLYLDQPWEGEVSWCPVVLKEEGRLRMWYRARSESRDKQSVFSCYAESGDGIHWERPDLGLVDFEGSRHNNICIATPDAVNVAVFRDERADVSAEQRYKAVGRWSGGRPSRLYGLVSPDGIHWKRAEHNPLLVAGEDDGQFDSPLGAFWDQAQERYAIYARGWHPHGGARIRAIRCCFSADFVHWEPWRYVAIDDGQEWPHHLYTNSAHPYYRAPYYLMFPKRFLPERTFDPQGEHPGQSDVVFMASRDGVRFRQLFKEALLRPGPERNNWHERSIFIGAWTVPTAPGEMSAYSIQNYRTDQIHIRRLSWREDGFVSVNGPYEGGALCTKPFIFSGAELELNYATSGAGSILVEVQDEAGAPLPGYELDQCDLIFGDQIERRVTWQGRGDVAALAGRPVRLRFALRDADLYSFCFVVEKD